MNTSAPTAHPPRRRHEGLLHRRGRDARARRHPPRDQERRVHRDRRPVGLRQVDAAVDPRPARLARPRASYMLNGKSVADLPLSERARVRNREIGFIFQSFNLIGDLNVYENVELPLTYRGMKSAERKERVMAALEKVGMAHRAKHLPEPALGRSAAARRGRPRGRRRAVDPAGRRADRKPRLEERRGGDGAAARAAPRRRDHLHGHARPALRAARRPLDPPVRRPRRRGRRHASTAARKSSKRAASTSSTESVLED